MPLSSSACAAIENWTASTSRSSVESMEPQQTSASPVVHGLSERSAWHGTTTGFGTSHCNGGTHNPETCEPGKSEHVVCSVNCITASDHGPPKHNIDCCCECTQTGVPCVGCTAVGYCTWCPQ